MKKLQIIILTLLLIFNINSNIYASEPPTEFFPGSGYSIDTIRSVHNQIINDNPDLNGAYPKGFFFIMTSHGYNLFFYYDHAPSITYNSDDGNYVLRFYDKTFRDSGSPVFNQTSNISKIDYENNTKYSKYVTFTGWNDFNIVDIDNINNPSNPPDGGDTQGLGILNNINNTINNLFRSINTLFSNIADTIKKAVENVLKGIKEILKEFLSSLKDMLKEIFIPDEEFLTTHFTEIKQLLSNKFDLKFIENINQLNTNQSLFSDITLNGNKIVDMQFLNQAIPKIRIFTDGFFWFLLICYQYDQLYFLIRGTKPLGNTVKTTFSKGSEQT